MSSETRAEAWARLTGELSALVDGVDMEKDGYNPLGYVWEYLSHDGERLRKHDEGSELASLSAAAQDLAAIRAKAVELRAQIHDLARVPSRHYATAERALLPELQDFVIEVAQ